MSPNGTTTAGEGPPPGTPGSETSSDSHQPEPQPAIPQVQVFGDNPLKFDDPTIYNIRDVLPGMTDDEKKEIYSVAHFPKTDLAHMAAGVAPDKDFSNAKPSNQVSANTFQTYIEPYVRPLTEEDIAWLKERVSQLQPYFFCQRKLTCHRVIVLPHSSCPVAERKTIVKSGRRRMECRTIRVKMTRTNCL